MLRLVGYPLRAEVTALTGAGRRQEWRYLVEYWGGDKQIFVLPCISLPFLQLARDDVIQRTNLSMRQGINSDAAIKLRDARSNIYKVLLNREELEYSAEWDEFFELIPTSDVLVHPTYFNALRFLAEEVGGKIQQKEPYFTTYKT